MKERLRSVEDRAYRVVNAGLLVCMALFGAERFLGMGSIGWRHLLVALAVLALLAGLNFMEARGRILCLAGALILACMGLAAAGPEEGLSFLRSFFPWFLGGGAAEERWRLGFCLLQTGIVAALCYLLEILAEKAPFLKAALGGLVFAALVLALAFRWEMNQLGVAFSACYLVLVCGERIQSRWRKVRMAGFKSSHMLWLMPFFVLYLWLMAVMPAPEEPYDWLWAKNIYGRVRESVLSLTRNIKWGSKEGFGMAFSGFSGDGALGGDLQREAKAVMTVRTESGGAQYLYLTGKIYDTFDGRGWSSRRQGLSEEAFWDTAQTLYAAKCYNREYWRDYLGERRLEIRYEDFQTGYVFAPLKLWALEAPGEYAAGEHALEERSSFGWEGGELRWEKKMGYGTEYGLRYFQMNLGQEAFYRFLEEAEGRRRGEAVRNPQREGGTEAEAKEARKEDAPGSEILAEAVLEEAVLAEVKKECRGKNGTVFSLEGLEEYRQEIYRDYLGEIRLSEEAEAYLEKILGNAVTGLEKLQAIERELSSFSYTLTPGELPDRVEDAGDFLDYFLLESRQGYCTYFATAFALLARTQGIPVRYVQGYCVPLEESGETAVYSYMAHAWPEAYLEGAGWIPFEPTPGYGERRRYAWEPEQPEDAGAVPSGDEAAEEDRSFGAGSREEPFEAEEEGGDPEQEEQEQGQEEMDKGGAGEFWKLFGIGLPVILTGCLMLLLLENGLDRYRYRKKSPEERLRMAVFRNLEILSWLGIPQRDQETLQELRERAQDAFRLAGAPDIGGELRFIEDYESVLYGGEEAGEEQLQEAMKAREGLLGRLKETRRWAYLYCRIRLYLRRYG